ncbi:MAG: phosphoadenosine phosphosulfate reductase family protein [Pseudomonadota bacterium]
MAARPSSAAIAAGTQTQAARLIEPQTIIAHELAHAHRPIITTNFRPGAIVLIHMVVQERADIPVVWIDSGYNRPETYRYIERMRHRLDLNLKTYLPRRSKAHRDALDNARIPNVEDDDFEKFAEEVKLEPFDRALREITPDVWFTGIRADQNRFRRELGVTSEGPYGIKKVAPLHHWHPRDLHRYLIVHDLEDNSEYFDPTKPEPHLECGVQLLGKPGYFSNGSGI